MDEIRTVRANDILAALPSGAEQALTAALHIVELPDGAVIFHEGERSDSASLILDGEVEIIKALGTAEERFIRVQGPDTLIGEMALLDPAGRPTISLTHRRNSAIV